MTLLSSRKVIEEGVFVRTKELSGCRNCQRELTSAKILDLIFNLKLPRDSHTLLVFHLSRLTPTHYLFCFFYWSWLTSMQYLFFFIGYDLHPRYACSSLVKAYTHAFLVSGNHFVDFIYGRMYLSTKSTVFIAGHILHTNSMNPPLAPTTASIRSRK